MASFSGFKYRDNNKGFGMWKNYGGMLYFDNEKVVLYGGLFSKKIAEYEKATMYAMRIVNEGLTPSMKSLRLYSPNYSYDILLRKEEFERLVVSMREMGFVVA